MILLYIYIIIDIYNILYNIHSDALASKWMNMYIYIYSNLFMRILHSLECITIYISPVSRTSAESISHQWIHSTAPRRIAVRGPKCGGCGSAVFQDFLMDS